MRNPPLSPERKSHCRDLRRNQTEAEKALWRILQNREFAGIKFRRQHPIWPYIADFYCHEARLVIELDGGQHSETEQHEYDEARTECMMSAGIQELRFWNNEVLQNRDGVLEMIRQTLTPTLSRREREKRRSPGG